MKLNAGSAFILAALLMLPAAGCTRRSDLPEAPGESSAIQGLPEESGGEEPEEPNTEQESETVTYTQEQDNELREYLGLFVSIFGPSSATGTLTGGEFFTPNALNEEGVLFFCLVNLYNESQKGLEELARYDDYYYAITPQQVQSCAQRLLGINNFSCKDEFYYDPEQNIYKYGPDHGAPMKIYQITDTSYESGGLARFTVIFYNQGDEQMNRPVMTLYYRFQVEEYGDGSCYLVPIDASSTLGSVTK